MQQCDICLSHLRETHFRDSLLLATSNLKAAASSYGVETKKGYLPHGYLQNCTSLKEILARINTMVPWSTLEPFIDWFTDVEQKELHKRVACRTWEHWRDEQPLREEFTPNEFCYARFEMEEYQKNDVICLYELVDKMGHHMWNEHRADIRTTCTIWEHC